MGQYIFRFPANMPKLTYRDLLRGFGSRGGKIGTTVTVNVAVNEDDRPWRCDITLYETPIATMYAGGTVGFNVIDDTHQATREWLQRIVQDNGIGQSVYRVNGVLLIDGKVPLAGCLFEAGRQAILVGAR